MMNLKKSKSRRILTGIIVAILILAMVVPTIAAALM